MIPATPVNLAALNRLPWEARIAIQNSGLHAKLKIVRKNSVFHKLLANCKINSMFSQRKAQYSIEFRLKIHYFQDICELTKWHSKKHFESFTPGESTWSLNDMKRSVKVVQFKTSSSMSSPVQSRNILSHTQSFSKWFVALHSSFARCDACVHKKDASTFQCVLCARKLHLYFGCDLLWIGCVRQPSSSYSSDLCAVGVFH